MDVWGVEVALWMCVYSDECSIQYILHVNETGKDKFVITVIDPTRLLITPAYEKFVKDKLEERTTLLTFTPSAHPSLSVNGT